MSRKSAVKGYILLESLLALALLAAVTSFMLSAVTDSQKACQLADRNIEALNDGKMAMDASVSQLTANGVSIQLADRPQDITLSADGKEVLHLEITAETK